MAIKLMKVNNSFNIQIQHFYIDNISDLDIIENEYKCQIGDIAELPDGAKYRRHSDDYSGNLWEYYTGGGSTGLPEVSSTDNGKVLKVVNGEWDKGNITINYGQKSYKTILNTTSFTTVQDGTYYKCDNVCSLASLNNGDKVRVTFDGTEYIVTAGVSRYGKSLGDGAQNFLHYPFYINTGTFPDNATLYTQQVGTYSIKIERQVTTPSQDFKEATLESIKYVRFMTQQLVGGIQITCNYSRNEVINMFKNETPIIASIDGIFCAQSMKWNAADQAIEFRVLNFTGGNNPELEEKIILVFESGNTDFGYNVNRYDLNYVIENG